MLHLPHLRRRLGALLAAGAITATVLTPAPAGAADVGGTATAGYDWLQAQLTDGLVQGEYEYPEGTWNPYTDHGLSVDVGIALLEGERTAAAQQIRDALEPVIGDYVTGGQWAPDDVYAGSVAKALRFVQRTGGDGTSYGGRNLVTMLEERTADAGVIVGRIEDKMSTDYDNDGNPDDYANTIGQAFAAAALNTAGSAEADEALSFLLRQQCLGGFFRLNLTADKTSPDQGCDPATDSPDTDATALAMILLEDQDATPTVAAALGSSTAWLVDQQAADGSFGGGTATEGANANSTGLAAWALSLNGRHAEATRAANWVRAHQVRSIGVCTDPEDGAVAYDTAAHTAEEQDGITRSLRDQFRRASAQAVPALELASAPPQALTVIPGTPYFVRAGSTQRLRIDGLAAGDQYCLARAGQGDRGVAPLDSSTATDLSVTMPAGTARRTWRVRDSLGRVDAATFRVLGAARLDVTLSATRVPVGETVQVVVRGLVRGEPARIRYDDRFVARAVANRFGVVRVSFAVGREVGRKVVRVTGRFADLRFGRAPLRVVSR